MTVASYTWTLLHDLVEAPPHPGERHHPLRLFIGSGMPRGLWRRVQARFRPARVLEFYASTEAGAILVNLQRRQAGRDGPPAARQRRGADRPPTTSTPAGWCSAPTGSCASAAPTRSGCCWRASRPDEATSDAAARRVRRARTRGCRPATCSGATPTATTGGSTASRDVIRTADGPRVHGADPRRAGRLCRRSTWRSPTASPSDGAEHELAVAAVTLRRPGDELDAQRARPRDCGALDRGASARRSSTSSIGSRSRPGSGR